MIADSTAHEEVHDKTGKCVKTRKGLEPSPDPGSDRPVVGVGGEQREEKRRGREI